MLLTVYQLHCFQVGVISVIDSEVCMRRFCTILDAILYGVSQDMVRVISDKYLQPVVSIYKVQI